MPTQPIIHFQPPPAPILAKLHRAQHYANQPQSNPNIFFQQALQLVINHLAPLTYPITELLLITPFTNFCFSPTITATLHQHFPSCHVTEIPLTEISRNHNLNQPVDYIIDFMTAHYFTTMLPLKPQTPTNHPTNAITQKLQQYHQLLNQKGILQMILLGGNSLMTMQQSLLKTEILLTNGATKRFYPTLQPDQLLTMAQSVGFKDSVVDLDRLEIHYQSSKTLLQDLRTSALSFTPEQKNFHQPKKLLQLWQQWQANPPATIQPKTENQPKTPIQFQAANHTHPNLICQLEFINCHAYKP